MRTPLVVDAPLHARVPDVLALLHRRGFSTSSAPSPIPPHIAPALVLALRGGSLAGGTPDPSEHALLITVDGLIDMRRGVREPAPESLNALNVACTEIVALLAVPPDAASSALVPPVSLSAARSSTRLLMPATDGFAAARATTAARAGSAKVDIDELLTFLFPEAEQHSRSVGRLITVALYGPLRDGKLYGGRACARALTPRELDAEIDTIERDDVLAVFSGGGVLGDIDDVLRTARAYGDVELPRMSKAQVVALLDAARDDDGSIRFHDLQKLVLDLRAARVRDMGSLFPPRKSSAASTTAAFVPRAPLLGRGTLPCSAAATLKPPPRKSALAVWEKSSDVARARYKVDLLNTHSTSIATIQDANSATMIPALLSNILLMRPDSVSSWRTDAPFAHSRGSSSSDVLLPGTRVPGSVSAGARSKKSTRLEK